MLKATRALDLTLQNLERSNLFLLPILNNKSQSIQIHKVVNMKP